MPISVSAGVPVNFQERAEELKKRQALIDAITARNMQAKPNASAATAVGDILSSVILGRKQKALAEERDTYSKEYSEGLGKALDNYTKARTGTPEQNLPADQAGPFVPAQAGDPRRAAIEAVSSGFGPLQQIGMQDLTNMGKEGLTIKDLLAHATPEAQEAMVRSGDIGAFKGKADLKTVGDVVYDPNTKQMVRLSGPVPQQQTINGDLYQASPSTGELKKLDNAPNIRMTVNANPVIAGQKKGMEAYFGNVADQVKELGKSADSSQQLLRTLGTLKELQAAGINSGITSDMVTTASALAKSMGLQIKDPAKLANTQTYNALLTDLWQRSVSQFGGNRGVTAEESKQIRDLLPLATKDPMAQQQLFTLMEGKAKRDIERYKGANKNFAAAASADDPMLFQIPDDAAGAYVPLAGEVPNPNVTGGAGVPMSLDDYIKAKTQGAQ